VREGEKKNELLGGVALQDRKKEKKKCESGGGDLV
jgi:hypothetical protein